MERKYDTAPHRQSYTRLPLAHMIYIDVGGRRGRHPGAPSCEGRVMVRIDLVPEPQKRDYWAAKHLLLSIRKFVNLLLLM